MGLLLIIFFISLAGLAFMIGKRMMRLKQYSFSEHDIIDDALVDMPYMDEIKYMTVKKMRQYGYVALFTSIKISMKSTRLVKRAGNEAMSMIKKVIQKKNSDAVSPQEVSKFLQMVSEYKHKIGKIKRRIREQEGIE